LNGGNKAKTIVVQTFEGEVSMTDYHQMVDTNVVLLNSVTYPVDIIMDTRSGKMDVTNFLIASSYANKKVPDNQRFVVVIGANKFLQKMTDIAHHIAPKAVENVLFVDTMDEAMAILEGQN